MKPIVSAVLGAVAAAALIVAFACGARADIAPDPMSRGLCPRPYGKDSTRIQMKTESVTLRLSPGEARVEAVFEMVNTGSAERLEIGWPVLYERDVMNLVVREDGRAMKTVFKETKEEPPQNAKMHRSKPIIHRWYLWKSHFRSGERKIVHVSYCFVPERAASTLIQRPWQVWFDKHDERLLQRRYVGYVLGTGALWAGVIEKAEICVQLEGMSSENLRFVHPGDAVATDSTIVWTYRDLKPIVDAQWNPNGPERKYGILFMAPDYTYSESDIVIVYSPHLTAREEIAFIEGWTRARSGESNMPDFTKHLEYLRRLAEQGVQSASIQNR